MSCSLGGEWLVGWLVVVVVVFFFFQAEDGIRDLVRSRGLGDVYKCRRHTCACFCCAGRPMAALSMLACAYYCPSYTSDAADEEDSVDLGGRRIIKKKTTTPNIVLIPL